MEQAIDLSAKGDYDGVVRILTKAIATEPKDAQAYFERRMALLNLDRDAEAIKDSTKHWPSNRNFPELAIGGRVLPALSGIMREPLTTDGRICMPIRMAPHTGMRVNPQQWADCAESFAMAGDSSRAKKVLEDYFANYTGKVTSYANYETAPMRAFARLLLRAGDSVRALEFAGRAFGSKIGTPRICPCMLNHLRLRETW